MYTVGLSHSGDKNGGRRLGERLKSATSDTKNEGLGMRIAESSKTQSLAKNSFTLSCNSVIDLY